MDLKEAVAADPDAEDEKKAVAYSQALADLIWQVHQIPKPTIAALNGDAMAGGAGLASACDFAIAAEGARLGYPEVRRGLVAAIVMHDLIRQVGDRRARDLLLSGRLIDAVEAERWGLVNRVVPAESLPGRGVGPGPLARRVGPPRHRDDQAAARRGERPPHRPSRLGRHHRGRPRLGRGPRRDPRLLRETPPALGRARPGAARRGPSDRASLTRGTGETSGWSEANPHPSARRPGAIPHSSTRRMPWSGTMTSKPPGSPIRRSAMP